MSCIMDLVTDFYEFGWGQSFHFAPRKVGESFKASLTRSERYLFEQLALKAGMVVLDIGCGIGGPMREIARHSGASIVGINTNAYQVYKAENYNKEAGLNGQCTLLNADFMHLPFCDNAVDAIYAIQATPHAPDKTALFGEIHRVLKPGAGFASYEWCLTDRYDPDSPEHRRIKREVEAGNGLADIAYEPEVVDALKTAGFEVIDAKDVALEADPETPWHRALQGRDLSLASIPRIPIGRMLTNLILRFLERIRIAPRGTTAVSATLNMTADALAEGGETGIFTPVFYFHARKNQRTNYE